MPFIFTDMKITHYVYELKHKITNEFYIGVRSCYGDSNNDNYMGSMKTWDVDKSMLVKTIINDKFETRKEANIKEIELLKENINHPLNRNYHIPTHGFCCFGTRHSDTHKRKLSELKLNKYKLNPQMLENNRIAQKNRWTNELKYEWSVKMTSINSTKEYRNKQIQSATNKVKYVLQFNKNGEFIKEYNSINEAARQLNVDKTCISRNCNGKYKSAFGYVWKFKI
jgi:hypothetical protein